MKMKKWEEKTSFHNHDNLSIWVSISCTQQHEHGARRKRGKNVIYKLHGNDSICISSFLSYYLSFFFIPCFSSIFSLLFGFNNFSSVFKRYSFNSQSKELKFWMSLKDEKII
jgi:hypothetical protein